MIQYLEIFVACSHFHFDVYYMSLVEIKDFNALIDNKPFLDHPVKKKQEAYGKPVKCQETMII